MTNNIDKEEFFFAVQEGELDKIKQFLQEGMPVNAFDSDLDWTALHYAVKEGHIEIIKYLLENGADVNAHLEEKIGDTPLGLVAQECSYEIAKLLVDAGANPTISGWMGISALQRSKKRKKEEGVKVCQLLTEAAKKFVN